MKKIGILLLLVVCLTCFSASYADGMALPFSDDPKAIQEASASVVMLNCYDKNGSLYSTGSAFAAFTEGVFVTNFHVMEGEVYSIKAQMETGLEFSISSVIACDPERDIAILSTEAKTGLAPLPLGDSSKIERGEKVIAIGSHSILSIHCQMACSAELSRMDSKRIYSFPRPFPAGAAGARCLTISGKLLGLQALPLRGDRI
ncbi:MAG: S1C family serine protease [Oscillospiraceae bacterium]|nr:S1C family serine protease [Oscillospiraceae bacterium]